MFIRFMISSKKKEINSKKRTTTVLFAVLVVICLVPVLIIYSVFVEDICAKRVKNKLENQRFMLMEPTAKERDRYGAGKMSLGFRQQLKCEKIMTLGLFGL